MVEPCLAENQASEDADGENVNLDTQA
jgi:hypothetical protein